MTDRSDELKRDLDAYIATLGDMSIGEMSDRIFRYLVENNIHVVCTLPRKGVVAEDDPIG